MTTFAEITLGAMALPVKEKVKLARVLLDEADDEASVSPAEAEQAWEEEIMRRVESVKNGTAKHMSWEDSMAELRRRHPLLKPARYEN